MFFGDEVPDVRDGLAGVHRRVLHGMAAQGLFPSARYCRSATVVAGLADGNGGVPPTGAYPALVDMAQDFWTNMPLVDGQGNFGSSENDPAAASPFTECRLSPVGNALTGDIAPGRRLVAGEALEGGFPNLLVNGCRGRAASFPPHNLGEVVDALCAVLDDPGLTTEQALRLMPGPDFPTGALVHDRKRLERAYVSGRGNLAIYARLHFEPATPADTTHLPDSRQLFGHDSGHGDQLVVTELPFGAVMNRYSATWGGLDRTLNPRGVRGVEHVSDESDQDGLRLVVELREGADPRAVQRDLYQHTRLRMKFPVKLTALVDGQRRTMSLVGVLRAWIDARRQTIGRCDAITDQAAIDDRIRRELRDYAEALSRPRRTGIAPQARPAQRPPPPRQDTS